MCFKPLTLYKTSDGQMTANPKEKLLAQKQEVPCGQCIACRLRRSSDWAARIEHEARNYDDNCFITLTYDEEHLPSDLSVSVKHYQAFMKALRRYAANNYPQELALNKETNELEPQDKKIRFFHCGEYGEINLRPHYHACLFNIDFPDKQLHSNNLGNKLYTSEDLRKLWKYGHVTIGALTKESAAYTARYIMKKINGDLALEHYKRVDPDTGEIHQVKPEYVTMSRAPGIGSNFYDEFKNDMYPKDFLTRDGDKYPIPKYYDKKLQAECPELHEHIKEQRKTKALASDRNTPARLKDREICAKARLTKLKREL